MRANVAAAERRRARAAPREGRARSGSPAAAEVMNAGFPRLEASLRLGDALRRFCQVGVPELPVVDAAGQLLGVFSGEEAVRLCVPEHLLWADDLPGLHEFGPFAGTLRSHAQTPLSDVVLLGAAHVTVSGGTPAIQAARLMIKHAARQVLVVEHGRLLGVITPGELIRHALDD